MKSSVWQFVGVIVGIIAIIVSIIIYMEQRPVKKLRVEVLSNDPLISVSTDIAQEIKIFYKNSPVHSLSLILLRFENTGNVPIIENDFNDPIKITLSSISQIGEVSIQETRPSGIQLTPTIIGSNQIELAKTLLNPGDQVIIKILAIDNAGKLDINARITGISNMEIQSVLGNGNTTKPSPNAYVGLFSLGILIIGLIGAGLWNSIWVTEWRKVHMGFDPARYYYIKAQEKIK